MRLLLIIGPPAVGKMTVGREIARRTGFRLMHNHHTIEPLVETFGHGTRAFDLLNEEFRRRVVEEAARDELDLIFSFVWDLDDPDDVVIVERLIEPYVRRGAEVAVVELSADLDLRLVRNASEDRLMAKPTKRDLRWSEDNVRGHEAHRLNSDPTGRHRSAADPFLADHRHLRLDTGELTVEQTADRVLSWLDDRERS